MSNGFKVLIGDNTKGLSLQLSRYLRGIGVQSLCRRNDLFQICETIAAEKPDAVLLTFTEDNGTTERLINKIYCEFPEVRIVVASYSSSVALCNKFIAMGAHRCVVMPCSMSSIYEAMKPHDFNCSGFEFEPVLYSFFAGMNYPTHLSGFRYLCTGVGLLLINPEYADDITNNLYEKISKIHNVSVDNVERSLRHVADIIFSRRIEKRYLGSAFHLGVPTERRLTNYELLSISADAFAAAFNIFDNPDNENNNTE